MMLSLWLENEEDKIKTEGLKSKKEKKVAVLMKTCLVALVGLCVVVLCSEVRKCFGIVLVIFEVGIVWLYVAGCDIVV